MDSKYASSQLHVIRGALHSIRDGSISVIEEITDKIGLSPRQFDNVHHGYMFQAVQQAYIDSIEKHKPLELGEVFVELEHIYRHNGHANTAGSLIEQWQEKVNTLDGSDKPIENARILRDSAVREAVLEATDSFRERFHESRNPDVVIADHIAYLLAVSAQRGHAITLQATLENKQEYLPETTGYPRLDGKANIGPLAAKRFKYGGWYRGRYVSLVGAPGSGKSSVIENLAARRAEVGRPSVIHSFEMDRETIYCNIICSIARVGPGIALNPERAENNSVKARIIAAHDMVEQWVRVYEEPTTIAGLGQRYRRHHTEYGCMTVHFIDHLWAFITANQSSWQQTQVICKDVKQFGRVHDACTVMVCHPSPDSNFKEEFEKNNRVVKCEAYGGKAVTQWSDSVIAMGRHNGWLGADLRPDLANTTIFQGFKNRQGLGTAERSYFGLKYDPQTNFLSNVIMFDDQAKQFQVEPQPEPVTAPLNLA